MQNLLSAVVGGFAVGAVFLLFAPAGPGPFPTAVPAPAGGVDVSSDPVSQHRLGELDQRLRRVEARRDATAEPGLVRTPVEAAVRSDLRARVQTLAAELADLRRRVSLTEFEPHVFDDPDEGRRVIEGLIGRAYNNKRFLALVGSIPLHVRFLESWPRHENAPSHLESLIEACSDTRQLHKAMAAIERFGPKMALPGWRLDFLRLQAAHRDVDRIEIAQRVLRSPVETHQRAWAMMRLAQSLARTGRRAEALAAIQVMLGEFAGTEAGAGYVQNLVKLRKQILARR